jgi:hypothetical protein
MVSFFVVREPESEPAGSAGIGFLSLNRPGDSFSGATFFDSPAPPGRRPTDESRP